MGLRALHVQPDVHMCDWVSPFQSARVADVGVSKEREKQRLLLITKKEKKKGKESWSVRVFFFSLTLRLESRLRKGSYRRTEQSA